MLRWQGLRGPALWLVVLVIPVLFADRSWIGPANAGPYRNNSYHGSIRNRSDVRRVQLRNTRHNSSGRRKYNNTRGGYRANQYQHGKYQHGSIRYAGKFKSSDKYGPPRRYNPYSKP